MALPTSCVPPVMARPLWFDLVRGGGRPVPAACRIAPMPELYACAVWQCRLISKRFPLLLFNRQERTVSFRSHVECSMRVSPQYLLKNFRWIALPPAGSLARLRSRRRGTRCRRRPLCCVRTADTVGFQASLCLLCISIDIFVEKFQQLVPTGIANSFGPGYGERQFSQ